MHPPHLFPQWNKGLLDFPLSGVGRSDKEMLELRV